MTLEQIQSLTDEEIRVKIAELCGWKRRAWQDRKGRPCKSWTSPEGHDMAGMPPNYPADLDACAEFEKTHINATTESLYRNFLVLQCGEGRYHRSTARQRCNALLATMTP